MNKLPTSTYRLQFRTQMGFCDARKLVPYLEALGVDWLYASPLLRAREGSTHGYDVVDPTQIDPVLGDAAEFEGLSETLREHGIGLLLDVVPNHMTAHGLNPWWRDLLAHGRASGYAEFFDIRWEDDPEGRLVLPVLGRHYGEVLEAGELVPDLDAEGFLVRYHDHILPLDPRTWAGILRRVRDHVEHGELEQLIAACEALPPRVSDPEVRARRAEATAHVRELLQRVARDAKVADALRRVLGELTVSAGDPESAVLLHHLLEAQPYRLAFWRSGLGELNYRRFFDIAELIALRAERLDVFEATHALPFEMLKRGQVHGLRIDHVDGLADPLGYVRRLRERNVPYVVVEKILSGDEQMREDWPADGTTGYEFIKVVAPLFVDNRGFSRIEATYLEHRDCKSFEECVRACKNQAMEELFSPGLSRLTQDLRQLTPFDLHARDLSYGEVERAIRVLTAELPVYRSYVDQGPISPEDEAVLEGALERSREHVHGEDKIALEFIGRVFLRKAPWDDPELAPRALACVRRWQQLSGPVMAKGLEDTALYRYTPMLALNEVGAHPVVCEDPVAEFHAWGTYRSAHAVGSLNTTSTHDTKRGEDTRARLYGLTELAEDWIVCRDLCMRELERSTGVAPDPDELELLLQTVVGAWPFERDEQERFRGRVHEYLVKATREAKMRTSWLRPNEQAERELRDHADALFEALHTRTWGAALLMFTHRLSFLGMLTSLSQLALKLGAPGVCDIYQGTELWDLTLVDPDNRRPVDFARRYEILTELQNADIGEQLPKLREQWTDARLKLLLTSRGLKARNEYPDVFVHGDYIPLAVEGPHADHVVAFARRATQGPKQGQWLLVAVGRKFAALSPEDRWPLASMWEGTKVRLPRGAPKRWTSIVTQTPVEGGGELGLSSLFAELPVGLWLGG